MPQSRKSQLSFVILLSATLLLSLAMFMRSPAPKALVLWPQGAPGAIGQEDADTPTLKVFLPPNYNASRAGVVICPGGAYRQLMLTYEGDSIAEWLNSIGVAAFVLKYRIHPRYHYPAGLEDALRAVRLVRHHANAYNIDTDKIGIMGFSAGGHLASTVATHFDKATLNAADPVDQESSRPDFAVLGYPLITYMPPLTKHTLNLLGPNATEEMREEVSNQLHVTPETPPVFMFHTNEDNGVPPENSVMFYEALRKNNIPVEMHIFEKGEHGAGLGDGRNGAPNIPTITTWPDLLMRWMAGRGLLSGRQEGGI